MMERINSNSNIPRRTVLKQAAALRAAGSTVALAGRSGGGGGSSVSCASESDTSIRDINEISG